MPHSPRPCALVLAADLTARDVALARFGTRTLIEEHVLALRRAKVRDIAVVWHGDGHELPAGCGDVRVVLQPEAKASAFDSLVLGLFALDQAPVLVLPATNAVVDDDTLAMVAAEALESRAFAVVPRFGDRHGHPVALLKPGVEAVVQDALDPAGRHRLDKLLGHMPGVRPLDVADDSIARPFSAARVPAR